MIPARLGVARWDSTGEQGDPEEDFISGAIYQTSELLLQQNRHKAAMLAWAARQSLAGGLTDSLRDQA